MNPTSCLFGSRFA
jgi:hypothetical protein